MKLLFFVPLTFICGEHGFAIFAPYLVMFLASAYAVRHHAMQRSAKRLLVHTSKA